MDAMTIGTSGWAWIRFSETMTMGVDEQCFKGGRMQPWQYFDVGFKGEGAVENKSEINMC